MKEYLVAIIHETIERALFLKDKMRLPLVYPELGGLANRCKTILDERIGSLRQLLELLEADKVDIRYAWLRVRDIIREIEWTESYGIPPLYYQSEEVGLLNSLIFRIHKEINLQLESPSVACLSDKYYYTALFVNVIFVPLSESDCILHLPDLYHEIGHYVSSHRRDERKLESLSKKYQEAFNFVTDYYNNLSTQKRRENAPEEIIFLIKRIHSHWKYWIEEFFCDLFALYVLGPAFAWSHLHYCVKKPENIYQLSKILPQTHPSDEARIRMLQIALKRIGFDSESQAIENKWKTIMTPFGSPLVEYQYAYPNLLLEQIANTILEGIKASEFCIATVDEISNEKQDKIGNKLNTAWKIFWTVKPEEFRCWEKQTLDQLRPKIH
jgi:hypothetical protein